MDIKEFETGEHCSGEILSVNGIDYEDLKQDEILSFINKMFKNDINKYTLIKECFKICLEYLQSDIIDSSSSSCDQCGNFNTYNRYKI